MSDGGTVMFLVVGSLLVALGVLGVFFHKQLSSSMWQRYGQHLWPGWLARSERSCHLECAFGGTGLVLVGMFALLIAI